jgi:pyruvate/2-oxoglutarate dehydrogenase complex dihydrolipoamide acyltransferase (E2) component
VQERNGLHSFGRGDVVEYAKANPDNPPCRAAVFGVIHAEPVPSDNEVRRALVLYDAYINTFFLGTWPAWRRVAKLGIADFDCDNEDHVSRVSLEDCEAMVASYTPTNGRLSSITTRRQLLAKAAEAPPAVKLAQEKQKEKDRAERRRQDLERKAQEEAERKERERHGGHRGGSRVGAEVVEAAETAEAAEPEAEGAQEEAMAAKLEEEEVVATPSSTRRTRHTHCTRRRRTSHRRTSHRRTHRHRTSSFTSHRHTRTSRTSRRTSHSRMTVHPPQ